MTTSASDTRTTGEAPRLRTGSIGALGIIAMVIAATAPVTALSANFTLSIAIGAGIGTLGLLLVVAAVFALFTTGYVAMSRQVVSAGPFYEYIAVGLGRTTGSGFAMVATVLYNLGVASMALVTGFFGSVAAEALGAEIPWWLISLATLVIAGLCGHLGIGVATRVTSLTSGLQFAVLIGLCVAIAIQNPSGYTLDGLAPSAMFDGGFALSLVVIVLCFAGYEAAAVYGEEARSPHRTIKRATYGSLIALLAVFFVSTWSLLAAYSDPVATAQNDPGAFLFATADQYLGGWAGGFLVLLATGSFFSATISFSCLAHRYMFAMGRAGLISSRMTRIQAKRGTPHVASWTQIGLAALLIALFALMGSDPFLVIIPVMSGIVGLSLLVLLAACSAAFVAARIRGKLSGSTWSTIIAPAIATAAWLAFVAIFLASFDTLTDSSSAWVRIVAITVPIISAAYGAVRHRRQVRAGHSVDL